MTRPIDSAIREFVAASRLLVETLDHAGAESSVVAAIRRDGEALARALRQIRADLANLREAQHRAGDQATHVIAAYEHDLQGRLDDLSERLAEVERALLARVEVNGR